MLCAYPVLLIGRILTGERRGSYPTDLYVVSDDSAVRWRFGGGSVAGSRVPNEQKRPSTENTPRRTRENYTNSPPVGHTPGGGKI